MLHFKRFLSLPLKPALNLSRFDATIFIKNMITSSRNQLPSAIYTVARLYLKMGQWDSLCRYDLRDTAHVCLEAASISNAFVREVVCRMSKVGGCLELVGLRGRHGPLVARSVGELVAVASGEVVEH